MFLWYWTWAYEWIHVYIKVWRGLGAWDMCVHVCTHVHVFVHFAHMSLWTCRHPYWCLWGHKQCAVRCHLTDFFQMHITSLSYHFSNVTQQTDPLAPSQGDVMCRTPCIRRPPLTESPHTLNDCWHVGVYDLIKLQNFSLSPCFPHTDCSCPPVAPPGTLYD